MSGDRREEPIREDIKERIQEALGAYAEDVRERGGSMPEPHHAAGTIAT